MIYVTQLIYVREGHEADFERFEAIVLPRLNAYRGELILRLRPDPPRSCPTKFTSSASRPRKISVAIRRTRNGSGGFT